MGKNNYILQLIGHQKIRDQIDKERQLKQLSHGYLFVGVDQVGKKQTALWLAQKLLCVKEDKRVCGNCPGCKQVALQAHPDLLLVAPEEGKSIISISQIRAMQKKVQLTAFAGKHKIVIIDDAHRMNREAANALLKTLEEPPSNTIIIIVTSHMAALLPTVISRLRVVRFSSFSHEELTEYVRQHPIEDKQQKQLVSLAHGKIGWIIEMVQDPEAIEQVQQYQQDFSQLATSSFAEQSNYMASLSKKDKKDIELFLIFYLQWLREQWLLNLGKKNEMEKADAYFYYLKKAAHTFSDFRYNVNKRLFLENLWLHFPKNVGHS